VLRSVGLSREAELPSGGTLQSKLRALEEADFIAGFVPYGRRTKDTTYRLVDEFTAFHLKWMERAPRGALAGGVDYWMKKSRSPSYRAAAGYAFEGACLKHAARIADALGLAGVAAEVSWWRWLPGRGSNEAGAQVDLLFDREDGVITLCELKYSTEPFKLTKAHAHALAHKASVFAARTRTRKDVQIALVTPEAPAPSLWLEDVVDQIVTADALFA
jgi:hypothetical protein